MRQQKKMAIAQKRGFIAGEADAAYYGDAACSQPGIEQERDGLRGLGFSDAPSWNRVCHAYQVGYFEGVESRQNK